MPQVVDPERSSRSARRRSQARSRSCRVYTGRGGQTADGGSGAGSSGRSSWTGGHHQVASQNIPDPAGQRVRVNGGGGTAARPTGRSATAAAFPGWARASGVRQTCVDRSVTSGRSSRAGRPRRWQSRWPRLSGTDPLEGVLVTDGESIEDQTQRTPGANHRNHRAHSIQPAHRRSPRPDQRGRLETERDQVDAKDPGGETSGLAPRPTVDARHRASRLPSATTVRVPDHPAGDGCGGQCRRHASGDRGMWRIAAAWVCRRSRSFSMVSCWMLAMASSRWSLEIRVLGS